MIYEDLHNTESIEASDGAESALDIDSAKSAETTYGAKSAEADSAKSAEATYGVKSAEADGNQDNVLNSHSESADSEKSNGSGKDLNLDSHRRSQGHSHRHSHLASASETEGHRHLQAHHGADEPHPLIEFSDFCFAYDERPVLKHIDMHIHAGDSIVLMGDNGSGKSTLLKALNGLVLAQKGSYYFDGELVDKKSMNKSSFAKRLHQRVGFIFQDSDSQLFCASVEDEIAFGPIQMGLCEEEVARRVEDVCKLIGLDELRKRAPYNLSGGEKKKVAIACILSMNPQVYCFDEPLNGLDLKTRTWLIDFFRSLKDAGKTLIIATHDRSLADEIADYFIFMGDEHGYTDKPHIHIN